MRTTAGVRDGRRMDRNRFAVVPGTHLVDRFLWLIGVPTGSCIAAWVLIDLASPGTVVTAHRVAAALPLIGLAGVLGYRWLTRDYVNLAFYIPFAIGALVFAPAMVDLAASLAVEPDGAQIPIVAYGVGFLLPFIAFGCGAAAFIRVASGNRA